MEKLPVLLSTGIFTTSTIGDVVGQYRPENTSPLLLVNGSNYGVLLNLYFQQLGI